MSAASPHVYTTTHLFEKTKTIVRRLVTQNPRITKVLDAPAGAGAFSKFLTEELRLKVHATDIDPSKWEYPTTPLRASDLGRKLPYKKSDFDLVVCLEGLKHVSDVSTAIRELTRVLKPGGYLVLTIPNDLNVESRLNYLFSGFVDTDWKLIDPESPDVKSQLYVRSLVHLPYLNFMLEENNLQIVETAASRLRNFSLLLTVILYPFLYWRTRKACGNHPLLKHLTSLTWLAGRHGIIVCRKRG
jgi:SAM-dependent methyltransferase